jgi:hypothetical protein
MSTPNPPVNKPGRNVHHGTPTASWPQYPDEIWGMSDASMNSSTDDSRRTTTPQPKRQNAVPPTATEQDSAAPKEPFARFLRPPQTREEAEDEAPLPSSILNFSPDPVWMQLYENIKSIAEANDDEVIKSIFG